MLDTFSILFTTVFCVFVAFRAVLLDKRLPWFGSGPEASETPSRRPRG
jgi:hypothetical protein